MVLHILHVLNLSEDLNNPNTVLFPDYIACLHIQKNPSDNQWCLFIIDIWPITEEEEYKTQVLLILPRAHSLEYVHAARKSSQGSALCTQLPPTGKIFNPWRWDLPWGPIALPDEHPEHPWFCQYHHHWLPAVPLSYHYLSSLFPSSWQHSWQLLTEVRNRQNSAAPRMQKL